MTTQTWPPWREGGGGGGRERKPKEGLGSSRHCGVTLPLPIGTSDTSYRDYADDDMKKYKKNNVGWCQCIVILFLVNLNDR